MKKYGIFYGSATGTTADVACRIAAELGVEISDVINVAETSPAQFGDYETLILGTSTWGDGEIEDDWYDLLDGVQSLSLRNHNIALFGCGDENMTDTFCNGVGRLYEVFKPTGANFIAPFTATDYTFKHTDAEIDGKIVGLLIDEVNHPELTDSRIKEWTELVKKSVPVTA